MNFEDSSLGSVSSPDFKGVKYDTKTVLKTGESLKLVTVLSNQDYVQEICFYEQNSDLDNPWAAIATPFSDGKMAKVFLKQNH